MEIIPLVIIKKRKMVKSDGGFLSVEDLKNLLKKDDLIYLYDIDGIEKDKPNLCLFQKISKFQNMWTDPGPRVIGDIVDLLMAGATNITLRKNLWNKLHIPDIREISECNLFSELDLSLNEIKNMLPSSLPDVEGYVLIDKELNVERDFQIRSFLKNFCINNKVYIYEAEPKNLQYWKMLGVTGLLINIDKIKEVQ